LVSLTFVNAALKLAIRIVNAVKSRDK